MGVTIEMVMVKMYSLNKSLSHEYENILPLKQNVGTYLYIKMYKSCWVQFERNCKALTECLDISNMNKEMNFLLSCCNYERNAEVYEIG